MKTHPIFQWITALLLAAPLATAQEPVKIAETPYEVIERGPHERVWQREVQWQGSDGRVITETHSYIETHTGMHYWEDEQWKESQELIEVFEQGAVARHGQTKVIFSPAIDDPEGSVIIETPDGQMLRTGILALNFTDPISGEQVTLGIVKESYGELVPPNRIVYFDAFDGVKADVIYTYTKAGLTQDVLLLEQPPAPELLGLSEESRLEIMTEIFEAPEPEKRLRVLRREEDPVKRDRMAVPDFVDEELYFGEMVIGPGRAFWQNAELGEPPEPGERVEVAKRWYEAPDGRRVLIESAPHQELDPLMRELPEFGEEEARVLPEKRDGLEDGWYVPERQLAAVREDKPVLLAQLGTYPKQGLNLDYTTLNSNQTNYTFKGDTTYYITGSVNLYGTTTLEGGCVIKFDKYNSGTGYYTQIYVRGPLECKTDEYRPAIFTAKDDTSVGEFVSGGTLSGYYGYAPIYLYDTGTAVVLEHVLIKHVFAGPRFYKNTGSLLRHATVINCAYGLYANLASLQARNVLVDGAASYGLYVTGSGAAIRGENLTLHDASNLRFLGSGTSLALTNSLFVDVTTMGSFTGSHNATNSSYSATFRSVGAGDFYLPPDSPYLTAGTTNIHADLLEDLRLRTVFPPVVLSNTTFSVDTTLYPQAARDTGPSVSLGYHYLPIDWAITDVTVTNASLFVTNGAVLAMFGTRGTILRQASEFVSEGTATAHNHLAQYQAVQEQPVVWGGTGDSTLIDVLDSTGNEARLRFTTVSRMAGTTGKRQLFKHGARDAYLSVADSELRGVYFHGYNQYTGAMSLGFTNNLFLRCEIRFEQGGESEAIPVFLYNNLFHKGSLNLSEYDNLGGNWYVKDNLFDCDSIWAPGSSSVIVASHNGFRSGLTAFGTSNVTVSTLDYQDGPLGAFYYPNSGGSGTLASLINAGSRTAAAAGLYHFATQINQTKEAGSTVDIGFHYVAVDGDGYPFDTDGDGLADYLEDRDGDGVHDTGETNWQSSENGTTGVTGLLVFTTLE